MPTISLTTTTSMIPLRHCFLPRIPPRSFSTAVSFNGRRRYLTATAAATDSSSAVSTSDSDARTPEELEGMGKVGVKVKVIVPMKVFHIPKVPELNLEGMEGVVKDYVAVWKGKSISATFPFKVEFLLKDGIEGRRPGPLKFFAHVREDEVEFLPDA